MAHPAIGDWQLERYRLGELPAGELDAVRTALATDGDLAERLARLDRSDRDILERHPPARLTLAIRARAAAGTPVVESRRAVLHYVDGMTLEQVARECGMSVSGVRKRLRGLRSELRVMEQS